MVALVVDFIVEELLLLRKLVMLKKSDELPLVLVWLQEDSTVLDVQMPRDMIFGLAWMVVRAASSKLVVWLQTWVVQNKLIVEVDEL